MGPGVIQLISANFHKYGGGWMAKTMLLRGIGKIAVWTLWFFCDKYISNRRCPNL